MIQTKTFKGFNKQVFDHYNDIYRDVWVSIDTQINEFLSNNNIEYVDLKPNGNQSVLIYRIKK